MTPKAQLPAWQSVLAAVAHPDDESFALGAVLTGFAAAGVQVSVLCLTRGEASTLHGVAGDLVALRAHELAAAAEALGPDRRAGRLDRRSRSSADLLTLESRSPGAGAQLAQDRRTGVVTPGSASRSVDSPRLLESRRGGGAMTDPSAIDELLAQARSNLARVPVEDLANEVAQGGRSSSTSGHSSSAGAMGTCPAPSWSTATSWNGDSTRPRRTGYPLRPVPTCD